MKTIEGTVSSLKNSEIIYYKCTEEHVLSSKKTIYMLQFTYSNLQSGAIIGLGIGVGGSGSLSSGTVCNFLNCRNMEFSRLRLRC